MIAKIKTYLDQLNQSNKMKSFFLRTKVKPLENFLTLPSTPVSLGGEGHMVSVLQNTLPLIEGEDYRIDPQEGGASKVVFTSPQPTDVPINVFMMTATP